MNVIKSYKIEIDVINFFKKTMWINVWYMIENNIYIYIYDNMIEK